MIKAVHSLPCFPYYDMAKDVQRLTEDFIEFCYQHGFMRALGLKLNEHKEQ